MIIKSMSRKVPSFGQLIDYINREDGHEIGGEQYQLRHNLMGRDYERIREEFERNGSLLRKRKNGVYLYHEILSITRAKGLEAEAQKERLMEIARQYLAARCPDNLAYGGVHEDKDHSFHMHLMISANCVGETGRLRLSKAQFREVQVSLERHVLQTYPELEQKVAIDKRADRGRSKGGEELERRTGKRPKCEEMLGRIQTAFDGSMDRQSLLDAFGREGLELYVRGKTLGVVDLESGKKHRLKTLDLEMADRVALRMEGGELASGAEVKVELEGEKEKEDFVEYTPQEEQRREGEHRAQEAPSRAEKRKHEPEDEMHKRRDDPETGTEFRDPEIPDVAYDAAEKFVGGKGGPPGRKIFGFAKKVLKQGMEEARIAGDLLRRGVTGDHEPAQDQPEKPTEEREAEKSPDQTRPAPENTGQSAQQEKWRAEMSSNREAGRDGPDLDRE